MTASRVYRVQLLGMAVLFPLTIVATVVMFVLWNEPSSKLAAGVAMASWFVTIAWTAAWRFAALVAQKREHARGYTTFRAEAGRYRYVDPKAIVRGVVPPAPTPDAVAAPRLVPLRPFSEPATARESSRSRTVRFGITITLVVCSLGIGAARIVVLVVEAPSVGWVLLPVIAMPVLVVGAILSVPTLTRADAVRRRKTHQDSAFLVGCDPVMITNLTLLRPGLAVRVLLVLTIDTEGIRFWPAYSSDRNPIIAIPWQNVTAMGLVDAAAISTGLGDRVVIRALIDGTPCDLPFQAIPVFPFDYRYASRRRQIAAALTASRKTAEQDSPASA